MIVATNILISLWLILASSCCVVHAAANAKDSTPDADKKSETKPKSLLIVGTEWPPFEYTEDDQFIGTDVDILREVFSRMNIPIEIVSLPWVRAIQMIKNKTADVIFTLRKSEEREAFMIYPDEPINISRNVFIHRRDLKHTVKNLEDLNGLLIGSVRGYAYGDHFKNSKQFRHDYVTEDKYGFLMVERGRTDLFISDLAVGRYFINKLGLGQILTHTEYAFSEFQMYAAFAKTEKHQIIAGHFSSTLREVKEDGTYQTIMQRYQLGTSGDNK